eukprot:TRINITY_DN3395_c0_g1_i1.p1 TRINITY_DN3395_c0_g1~~TRINITY_DN3395_c0_g1_i1.p1  ORF type:complete len:442 (+),score=112.72 TRINITY_DN3395_c0_g1_i1:100-1326(+)
MRRAVSPTQLRRCNSCPALAGEWWVDEEDDADGASLALTAPAGSIDQPAPQTYSRRPSIQASPPFIPPAALQQRQCDSPVPIPGGPAALQPLELQPLSLIPMAQSPPLSPVQHHHPHLLQQLSPPLSPTAQYQGGHGEDRQRPPDDAQVAALRAELARVQLQLRAADDSLRQLRSPRVNSPCSPYGCSPMQSPPRVRGGRLAQQQGPQSPVAQASPSRPAAGSGLNPGAAPFCPNPAAPASPTSPMGFARSPAIHPVANFAAGSNSQAGAPAKEKDQDKDKEREKDKDTKNRRGSPRQRRRRQEHAAAVAAAAASQGQAAAGPEPVPRRGSENSQETPGLTPSEQSFSCDVRHSPVGQWSHVDNNAVRHGTWAKAPPPFSALGSSGADFAEWSNSAHSQGCGDATVTA